MESPPPPVAMDAAGCAGVASAMRLPGPPAGIGGGGGLGPRLGAELIFGSSSGADLAPAPAASTWLNSKHVLALCRPDLCHVYIAQR